MPGVDLEGFVHRELRQLPPPAAPSTLLPRVLAAVQAWALRPWYARPWFHWPAGWQTVSIAALVVIVAGGVALEPEVQKVVLDAIAARASHLTVATAAASQDLETSFTAARVVWRAVAAPLVPYAFAVVLLMCLACFAFGTALNLVAFERS
jgi:hypothetical protein